MTVKDLLNHPTQVPRNNCKGIGRFYHQSMMKLPEFIEEPMSIHNSCTISSSNTAHPV